MIRGRRTGLHPVQYLQPAAGRICPPLHDCGSLTRPWYPPGTPHDRPAALHDLHLRHVDHARAQQRDADHLGSELRFPAHGAAYLRCRFGIRGAAARGVRGPGRAVPVPQPQGVGHDGDRGDAVSAPGARTAAARRLHGGNHGGHRPAVHGGVGAVRQLAARLPRSPTRAPGIQRRHGPCVGYDGRHDGEVSRALRVLMFELPRDSAVPLVDQICERITQLVRHGQLPAGARLPSIRKFARQVGASPFTVVDAYDRLVARGVIEPRAGRGFFVTQRLLSAPLTAIEALPELGSDALELARLCLQQRADVIAAGSGFLPESWLLEAGPGAVLTRLVRGRRTRPWLPCPPEGLGELREQIAARLVQHGIAAAPANIVTTYGASHAFDLLARILLSPGDAVLVEDPGYFVLFEQLRAHHVRLIPVPRHADGPDLAALEA